jgi:multiple sugar transport system ATP-binding protein
VATIGARTEHLNIRKAKSGGNGIVDWVEHLGDQNHLHVKIGSHRITTLTTPTSEFLSGDKVVVELDRPLYFDSRGQRIARQ